MSQPVAIVTGAASGIGLAVTKHLLSRGYKVAMADVNETVGQRLSSDLGLNTIFQRTDVSLYPELAATFARAFEFGGGRLDFAALNAGIDDRQSLYQDNESMQVDENGLPTQLDLKTMQVDVDAVLQGIWLFKYFARKNKDSNGGQIVITSSAAGLYPLEQQPQYCTAKHALVGLTRSCGPVFLRKDKITINCICPAFVETNLCPPHVRAIFPPEHITPMTTILRAYDTFINDRSMTGQTAEVSLDKIYFREQPDWANESQKWLGIDSKAFWDKAFEMH